MYTSCISAPPINHHDSLSCRAIQISLNNSVSPGVVFDERFNRLVSVIEVAIGTVSIQNVPPANALTVATNRSVLQKTREDSICALLVDVACLVDFFGGGGLCLICEVLDDKPSLFSFRCLAAPSHSSNAFHFLVTATIVKPVFEIGLRDKAAGAVGNKELSCCLHLLSIRTALVN